MLKQLTFIVALLFALWGQAQTETTLRHIDILAYNTEGELYFYWQKGKDKFLELELDYEEDEKADYKQELYDLKLTYDDKEDWETLKDIKRGEKKIIYLNDIQCTPIIVGHLGWFQVFAIVNSAAINIRVHVSLYKVILIPMNNTRERSFCY